MRRKVLVERFGPQMVPVRGRGYDKADVRIFAIDPLFARFLAVPGPRRRDRRRCGPAASRQRARHLDRLRRRRSCCYWRAHRGAGIARRVRTFVSCPSSAAEPEAKFGLDLKPYFSKIAGADQPGTYLVGLRPTNGGKRQWLRAQVTDLSLSAVEEAGRVYFALTSLSTAKPVQQAQIQFEGVRERQVRHPGARDR